MEFSGDADGARRVEALERLSGCARRNSTRPRAGEITTERRPAVTSPAALAWLTARSEEHTSELQSHVNLVCRLLLEKKKKNHDPETEPPPCQSLTLYALAECLIVPRDTPYHPGSVRLTVPRQQHQVSMPRAHSAPRH